MTLSAIYVIRRKLLNIIIFTLNSQKSTQDQLETVIRKGLVVSTINLIKAAHKFVSLQMLISGIVSLLVFTARNLAHN